MEEDDERLQGGNQIRSGQSGGGLSIEAKEAAGRETEFTGSSTETDAMTATAKTMGDGGDLSKRLSAILTAFAMGAAGASTGL
jgi:hypothetical protein